MVEKCNNKRILLDVNDDNRTFFLSKSVCLKIFFIYFYSLPETNFLLYKAYYLNVMFWLRNCKRTHTQTNLIVEKNSVQLGHCFFLFLISNTINNWEGCESFESKKFKTTNVSSLEYRRNHKLLKATHVLTKFRTYEDNSIHQRKVNVHFPSD